MTVLSSTSTVSRRENLNPCLYSTSILYRRRRYAVTSSFGERMPTAIYKCWKQPNHTTFIAGSDILMMCTPPISGISCLPFSIKGSRIDFGSIIFLGMTIVTFRQTSSSLSTITLIFYLRQNFKSLPNLRLLFLLHTGCVRY